VCGAGLSRFDIGGARQYLQEHDLDLPLIELAGLGPGSLAPALGRLPSRAPETAERDARTAEKLAEQEAYLRAVLENVADGIITFEPSGRIESFNRSAERIYGCTAAEAIGEDIATFVPDAHPQAEGARPRALMGTALDGSSFAME